MNNEEVMNNQPNENENKKKNYFNLIIGVSTLIIAILGASFAYFTVRGGSAENEIAVQAAYVKIGYEGGTKVKASDLIPTSESVMLWAYQDATKQNTAFEGDPEDPEAPTTYQCLDKNNKKVCYVYRFTINSEGEEIILPNDHALLFFLTRMQDEVHRFAISYHHNLRSKSLSTSFLDQIDGIGPKRKELLLKVFGSLKNIKEAPLDELKQYIPLEIAKKIKELN